MFKRYLKLFIFLELIFIIGITGIALAANDPILKGLRTGAAIGAGATLIGIVFDNL